MGSSFFSTRCLANLALMKMRTLFLVAWILVLYVNKGPQYHCMHAVVWSTPLNLICLVFSLLLQASHRLVTVTPTDWQVKKGVKSLYANYRAYPLATVANSGGSRRRLLACVATSPKLCLSCTPSLNHPIINVKWWFRSSRRTWYPSLRGWTLPWRARGILEP